MADHEWELDPDHLVLKKQLKQISKKHPKEYESCFTNLNKIIEQLNNGYNLKAFHFNFFKSEHKGVYRIGQTAVTPSMETRLYVCFDEENKVCYILAIGGKQSQSSDIVTCQKVTGKLLK